MKPAQHKYKSHGKTLILRYNNNNNNITKCKSSCMEVQGMLNLKCKIIAVTVGATGIVTKVLKKNLEAIPGKHSVDSIQKAAVLGTSH